MLRSCLLTMTPRLVQAERSAVASPSRICVPIPLANSKPPTKAINTVGPPKHVRGAAIFARVIADIKRKHSDQPSAPTSLLEAIRRELDAQMLNLLRDPQRWPSILRAYIYHLYKQPRTIDASDPVVLLMLRFVRQGNVLLSPTEALFRVEKLVQLLAKKNCTLTPRSYLAILSAIHPPLSPFLTSAALKSIQWIVHRRENMDSHTLSRLYPRQEYKEMRTLAIPVHSAVVYGRVLGAAFGILKPPQTGNCYYPYRRVRRLGPNKEYVVDSTLKFVQTLLDDMTRAGMSVPPRLLSILLRGLGDLLQYSSRVPTSSETVLTILQTIGRIRISTKVHQQTAMVDFAWAETLLTLHEAARSPGLRPNSRPIVFKELILQISDSPSVWSYENAIQRIQSRAWRTRFGAPLNGCDPSMPWYHGHQISYVEIELHRFAILIRHCLLHHEFDNALCHFLQMKELLEAFESSVPQFLASYPNSTLQSSGHNPFRLYKHPSSLIRATSRGLRFRLCTTFQYLLDYLVDQQISHPNQFSPKQVQRIAKLLGCTSAFTSFDMRFFLRTWSTAICTLLDSRVPYIVTPVDVERGNVGMCHILELDVGRSNSEHNDFGPLTASERSYFRRKLMQSNYANQLVRCAARWAKENAVRDDTGVEEGLDVLKQFLETSGVRTNRLYRIIE
ncbi:uncharacterized protein EI90DRAFT_3065127 [Cantharellus anzutake]|uniref:uncharacterized protein n=1 Tax=Cantharellus anzutake TaxID=1750568 RepID=UPI0019032987|nr:uncharacterized protein EI90DRAFT_3065127 [Cantharellus anzutake]KAF8328409.1 hypothetical protein EI90DRAFT_3065127 [Cantharellus anzutake]